VKKKQIIKVTLNVSNPIDAVIMDYLQDKKNAAGHLVKLSFERLIAGGGSQPAAPVTAAMPQAEQKSYGPTIRAGEASEVKGKVAKLRSTY
jgi:hypothetical protein